MLRRAEAAADRYGRLVAYAYTERDGDELFIEGEMIAAGLGRVDDRVGNMVCAAALFGREQAARKARRGLWSDPAFAILDAGVRWPCWRNKAALRWSKARWLRCMKAAPQST